MSTDLPSGITPEFTTAVDEFIQDNDEAMRRLARGPGICSPCWFHDCKNCTGNDCWHAERDEHYEDEP